MSKNMIYIDLSKFNSDSRKVYEIIIKDIFKHLVVRTTENKLDLLQQIETRLPVQIEGDRRKIKIVTIVRLMNNIADTHGDGELYYETKKLYNNKNNKVSYTTGYFFYFK